ncbi:MAG: hypothetical protein HY862_16755 [Chloroflexi bacterium]|nr:hypothetical protein [Chloroflexota bacterium]
MAFALRIHRLDAVDLRGDEAFTVIHWTKIPFSDTWFKLIKTEPNPGALVVYWAWRGVMGQTVFAMRMLSVFASLFGVAVGFALSHRLFKNWWLTGLVGFLWLLDPFLLWHAQDARNYSLIAALTPLNFYLLLYLCDQKPTPRWRAWLPYILVQTLALYIYYLDGFSLVVQAAYVLILGRRDLLKSLFRAWVVIGLLCVPLAIQIYVVRVVSGYQGTAAAFALSGVFKQLVPTLFLGDNTFSLGLGIGLVILLLLGPLIAIVYRQNKEIRGAGWLILLWMVVPITLLSVLSTQSNIFLARYVIMVTPALILSIGIWVALLKDILPIAQSIGRTGQGARAVLLFSLPLFISILFLHEINDYFYHDAPKAPDWQGLTDYLKARTTSHDVIISGSADPALEYYYTGSGDIYYVPTSTTKPTDQFAWLTDHYVGIYLLASDRTNFADAYLREHTQAIYGDTYPGVLQYRNWVVSPTEIEHPLAIQLGDMAILRGYTLLDGADGGVILLLYWEALRQTDTPYSVLVHVVNDVGEPGPPPRAVLDHGIANAIISTTAWQPGGLYRDPVAFPADIPSGHYTIRIGLYETTTGVKLPIIDPNQPDAEATYQGRYPIGKVQLD